MATKYARSVGGNWNTDATWSTTSSAGTANTVKPTSADDVILDSGSGQITIDAASVAKTVTCTGYTNTLTHNAFTLTVSGSVTLVSGMTYSLVSTAILSFAATATLTTGGKLIALLTHTSGTLTLGDNLSFFASMGIKFTLSGTAVDLNGKTVSGNTVTNRILILSASGGTGKQVTVNGGTFVNADFQDIIFSNATDLNLSGITGNSGNCGGNTITGGGSTLTFTAPATQTWNANTTSNWSTAANWTSRVPLPQDNVSINGLTSGTVTGDMPRAGANIDFTGSTGGTFNPAWAPLTFYGNFTWVAGLTQTGVGMAMAGRGSQTFTTAGVIQKNLTVDCGGGSYTLQDDFISTVGFIMTSGTINFNGHNTTFSSWFFNGSVARSITTGTGTSTVTSNVANALSINQNANMTVNFTGTTFVLSGVFSAGTQMIVQNGATTFTTMSLTGSGSNGKLSNSGCTIGTLNLTAPSTVTFTSGTTTTLTTLNATGSSGNVITINASTPGLQATLSKSAGLVSCDYLALTDSAATGGALFYAGNNSTGAAGQNNSGWLFRPPPARQSLSGMG